MYNFLLFRLCRVSDKTAVLAWRGGGGLQGVTARARGEEGGTAGPGVRGVIGLTGLPSVSDPARVPVNNK